MELQTEWRQDLAGGSYFDFAGMRAYFDDVGLVGEARRETANAVREAVQTILQERAAAAKKKPK